MSTVPNFMRFGHKDTGLIFPRTLPSHGILIARDQAIDAPVKPRAAGIAITVLVILALCVAGIFICLLCGYCVWYRPRQRRRRNLQQPNEQSNVVVLPNRNEQSNVVVLPNRNEPLPTVAPNALTEYYSPAIKPPVEFYAPGAQYR